MMQLNERCWFCWTRWVRQTKTAHNALALSAALGLGFTALCGFAFAAAAALPLFTATFVTALLVVSLFLAAVGYIAAIQVANGERPTLAGCARSVARRALGIGLFATLCGLIVAAWIRLTGVTFALYYGSLGLSTAEVARAWTSGEAPVDMLLFLGVSTVFLAATLFTVAVIALPRIVERDADIVHAVGVGVRVLKTNARTVTAWSMIVVMLVGVTLASQLLLMPLLFPLLAYATWFGYAELANE